MITPRFFTRTMLAGASARLDISGRYITIASISSSTVAIAIEDESPEQIVNGITIDCNRRIKQFRLVNTGGVASTVIGFVSDFPVDLTDNAWTALISGYLLNIEQEISGGATALQLADTVCPVTPGPGVQVFAANAAREQVEVSAPPKNGAGVVYLGITAARCNLVDNFKVLRAGESWWDEREKGAIFACSSTGAEVVNGREV